MPRRSETKNPPMRIYKEYTTRAENRKVLVYSYGMIITALGTNGFKISSGDTTIAVNPPAASSSHKVAKFAADLVLISAAHPDWDGEETASHGDSEPFVARGPGAYEVGDVVVNGFSSEGALVGESSPYANTVYLVTFDGMTTLVLGALSSAKLPQELRSNIDTVDIVLVPVGGATLDPKAAHDLVVSLEPKLVIPYAVGDSSELTQFLKIAGASSVKPVEKLTLRAKEVALMSGEIALLE